MSPRGLQAFEFNFSDGEIRVFYAPVYEIGLEVAISWGRMRGLQVVEEPQRQWLDAVEGDTARDDRGRSRGLCVEGEQ